MKTEEPKYNLAAPILELLLIERKHEDERSMIITKKANVIMVATLIYNIVMLFLIPFGKLRIIVINHDTFPLLQLFFFGLIFFRAIFSLYVGVDYGYSILMPSDYVSPDIDYLTDERFITYPHEDVVKNEFIHHYKQTIVKNREINDKKANALSEMMSEFLTNFTLITWAILIINC